MTAHLAVPMRENPDPDSDPIPPMDLESITHGQLVPLHVTHYSDVRTTSTKKDLRLACKDNSMRIAMDRGVVSDAVGYDELQDRCGELCRETLPPSVSRFRLRILSHLQHIVKDTNQSLQKVCLADVMLALEFRYRHADEGDTEIDLCGMILLGAASGQAGRNIASQSFVHYERPDGRQPVLQVD